MKHLMRFNESNENKIDSYIRKANDILNYDEEFEQGDEPSNVDLLSELGELSNDLEMTKGDMEKVVSSDKIKMMWMV